MLLVSITLLVLALMGVILRVPYVPTPPKVIDELFSLAELKGDEVIYDLGAGDARILIEAKRRYPGVTVRGCELVPPVWLLGKLRILFSRLDVDFQFQDAFRMDVSDADVLFLYLMPEVMRDLEERFEKQLKPGTRIISHSFSFARREPEREVRLPWGSGTKRLLVYRW